MKFSMYVSISFEYEAEFGKKIWLFKPRRANKNKSQNVNRFFIHKMIFFLKGSRIKNQ